MKKILSVILMLFILALFTPTAFAQSQFVVDGADLLTDDMESQLDSQISSIQSSYGIDVAIHTTMSIGYEDIHTYAESFYQSNGYGEDGLVFVINLNNNEVGNRDFYTYYQGTVYDTFGDEAYSSDSGFVNENVLPYLADEDYFSAFQIYLSLTEDYLSGEIYYEDKENYADDGYYDDGYGYYDDYYTDGITVGYSSEPISPLVKEIIVIVAAAVIAFVIVSVMKNKMNTAVIKNEASDYMKAGSMNVTRRLDVFTHRHVTKTAKPKNNSSGTHSGGGRSGGGFSGGGGRSGGGGGKF